MSRLIDRSKPATSAPAGTATAQLRAQPRGTHLQATPLLDFLQPSIAHLAQERRWDGLATYDRIGAIYDFVQNEIAFGYNDSDCLPASRVLQEGYGQCNTKATLIMALLRSVNIPCRLHGFVVEKTVQKGIITGLPYRLMPKHLRHSWAEVFYQEQWIPLEGCILDKHYLAGLRQLFPEAEGAFYGYGVATASFRHPPIEWHGQATYIQSESIVNEFGTFDAPDEFYPRIDSTLSWMQQQLFTHVLRERMNDAIARIRHA
jgi:hypothetical protein